MYLGKSEICMALGNITIPEPLRGGGLCLFSVSWKSPFLGRNFGINTTNKMKTAIRMNTTCIERNYFTKVI